MVIIKIHPLKPNNLVYIPNVLQPITRPQQTNQLCCLTLITSCQPITVGLEKTLAADWMSFVLIKFENVSKVETNL